MNNCAIPLGIRNDYINEAKQILNIKAHNFYKKKGYKYDKEIFWIKIDNKIQEVIQRINIELQRIQQVNYQEFTMYLDYEWSQFISSF